MKNILDKIKKVFRLGYKKAKIWDEFKAFIENDNHTHYALVTCPLKSNVEYVYYSPYNNKLYYSKNYAPMGKFANNVYYEYMGEL